MSQTFDATKTYTRSRPTFASKVLTKSLGALSANLFKNGQSRSPEAKSRTSESRTVVSSSSSNREHASSSKSRTLMATSTPYVRVDVHLTAKSPDSLDNSDSWSTSSTLDSSSAGDTGLRESDSEETPHTSLSPPLDLAAEEASSKTKTFGLRSSTDVDVSDLENHMSIQSYGSKITSRSVLMLKTIQTRSSNAVISPHSFLCPILTAISSVHVREWRIYRSIPSTTIYYRAIPKSGQSRC